MFRLLAVFASVFVFSNQKIAACGYSFVGDCSTSISLKINGTTDSFAVAPCPGVLKFDGFALGSLQSLSIVRAKAATWESCQNNVSGVELWYRVYEQGTPGGSWQSIDLQEDYNTLNGPYTTRYRSANTDENLSDGLAVGSIYVLEIYFLAEVDTIGDDFFPETTMSQDNNSQNYHFTFQYGGAAAPPFVVAVTKIVNPICHGDSTGAAGVTVYGDPNGLFYEWSTGGNNFPILSQLPAGTYAVTVTGASGYAASDTIEIAQPMPLLVQITTTPLLSGCFPVDTLPLLLAAVADAEELDFQWVYENQVISTDDSCFFDLPTYQVPQVLPELIATDKSGCSTTLKDSSSTIVQPAPIQLEALVTNPAPGSTDGSIVLDVAGGLPPYTIMWSTGSTDFAVSNLPEGTYCATVTDAVGCSSTICESLLSTGGASPSNVDLIKIAPNPAAPGEEASLFFPAIFANQEGQMEILDLQGRTLKRQNVLSHQAVVRFFIPENPPCGMVLIRIQWATGESAIGKLWVR